MHKGTFTSAFDKEWRRAKMVGRVQGFLFAAFLVGVWAFIRYALLGA